MGLTSKDKAEAVGLLDELVVANMQRYVGK